MKILTESEIQKRIKDALQESIPDEKVREEIAFHMTDWKDDLEGLIALYGEEEMARERVEEILTRFLAHAPNHIAAAQKLIGHGPIEDVFELGIFDEEDE